MIWQLINVSLSELRHKKTNVSQMRKQRHRSADERLYFRSLDSTFPLRSKSERTSLHKGFFLGPEFLNNILGTNSHIKVTCIAANFESSGPLVWCLLRIKSGWGISIPVLPEVIN